MIDMSDSLSLDFASGSTDNMNHIYKYGRLYNVRIGFHPSQNITLQPATKIAHISMSIGDHSISAGFICKNTTSSPIVVPIDMRNENNNSSYIRISNVYMNNITMTSEHYFIGWVLFLK